MLNINEIKDILPHRYPFLLVDKIIEMVPGEKVVGIKQVTFNEQFFQGHFPEEPVMPGVLILEALAQVGAIGLLSLDEFKGKIVYLGGINKAKFKNKVVPGDTLKLEVIITKRKGNVGIGSVKAYVDDKIATQAEITFAIGV